MAKKTTITKVGKRTLELTNLDKILFPKSRITKAELIGYYHGIAPTILRHVKGRPLSLVRWPDGIDGESFFQKNRPDFTPDWIETVQAGSDAIRYIACNEDACLCWLANLACIELHQMQVRQPHLDRPDIMVFDLDPPEGQPFPRVVEIGLLLKERLTRIGYHPFAKTSGKKGLHVVVPLEPKDPVHTVFEAAQEIGRAFVAAHPSLTTMQMKKQARGDKLFVDVYRNRQSQTVISAYSVRGVEGAPVSMPLPWEEIEKLRDPSDFNIHSVPARIAEAGDAWDAIGAYSVRLHTVLRNAGTKNQTNGQLAEYARKRSFANTPEPPPEASAAGSGHSFVVHRHHASHLHYDLRLETNGVLRSFAVPRGLPPHPGIKRLAVETEPHPLSYLTFEGQIPAGEYGAGQMWVYATGNYEITKEKKDGFYFRLDSRQLTAEYRMIHTKEKQWLLQRVDDPQTNWLADPPPPMLAESTDKPFDSPEHLFEIKWDGIRALITFDEGRVQIRSRSGRDITPLFPELHIVEDAFRATCGVFDGEIVGLDENGVPQFDRVLRRLNHTRAETIERLSKTHPAVCYLFDGLYLDGRAIVEEPLERRRQWLVDAVRKAGVYRVSEALDNGKDLFKVVSEHGLEGIVAKRRDSRYLPGKRSDSWLKIEVRKTEVCIIIGYTVGNGDRAETFGALHLARYRDQKRDKLRYMGKVGSGFDDPTLKSILKELKDLKPVEKPVDKRLPDDGGSFFVEPRLVCQVSYSSVTREGSLRAPVFLRLRPDLSPDDCVDEGGSSSKRGE
jgi:DNA ligase D-like protein (predicted polymerase)/DNA ligase D-like protein (predicted ligase)/DNA ligase D-like protein (predicted 3'-phosphoesterase)